MMNGERDKKSKKEQLSLAKNDKNKKVAEEKRLKVQQGANEIEDLFKQRKKVKEEEAVEELISKDREDSNEGKPVEAKSKKKKRDRATRSSEGWYENEDEAALIPVSDDDEEEPALEYGIIKSNYKRTKIVNPEAPLERIDKNSGLPVYKAHLLKVGEGGGTPLCPFDCNCCF